MFRRTLGATSIAVLAFVPEALQPLFGSAASEGPSEVVQFDWTDRQPVLIYDVSGGTLLGPVQSTVVVWSSGAVTYSRQVPFEEPVVGAMNLAPKALEGLVAGLEQAGADSLQDQTIEVADVPLRTVTVLGPTPDTAAHTFSFWIGSDKYAAVDAVLDRLMREVQPAK